MMRGRPRTAPRQLFSASWDPLRRGMFSDGAVPEYNVAFDVPACRAVFAADREKTITPLGTCASIVLRDERYLKVRDSRSPLLSSSATAPQPRRRSVRPCAN
jgi:hypothetical protein